MPSASEQLLAALENATNGLRTAIELIKTKRGRAAIGSCAYEARAAIAAYRAQPEADLDFVTAAWRAVEFCAECKGTGYCDHLGAEVEFDSRQECCICGPLRSLLKRPPVSQEAHTFEYEADGAHIHCNRCGNDAASHRCPEEG